jgi:hypothetical protein
MVDAVSKFKSVPVTFTRVPTGPEEGVIEIISDIGWVHGI